jgi:hypothetical protein
MGIVACSTTKYQQTSTQKITSLQLLDTLIVPYNLSFNNTTVGGLSSIDYSPKTNSYYFICDDRSAINPARFYTANISISNNKFDSIHFTDVHFLQQFNFKTYPGVKENPSKTPDPEALRFNPTNNSLVWTSEGERNITDKEKILVNPSIIAMDTKGRFDSEYSLTDILKMSDKEKGPRRNGVLESLTFNNNFKKLYTAVEEPLYQDGPRAERTVNGAFCRVFQYDVATKKNVAQYVYELDAVAHEPNPTNAFSVNGIVDMLWLNDKELLVMERSFSTGRLPCTIKLYIANFSNATNVLYNEGLMNNKTFFPATKKLLLNFDSLGIFTDNIEGITWGPILPNSNKTLLCVSDNNFSPIQKTQLLLFEVK